VFEAKLKQTLERIFQIKASFDQPSSAKEQEKLFIEIEDAKVNPKDGRIVAMVTGNCQMFGNNEKLPFGFFSKKIDKADNVDTFPFFFFDLEQNTRLFQNIVQRGFSFVYFFDSQYDPEIGTITDVNITDQGES